MPTWVNRTFYAAGWLTETRSRMGGYSPRFSTIQKGGVYAWYGDGELIYIGSSERLHDRIQQYFETRSIRMLDDGSYETKWGTFKELDLKVRMSVFFAQWATQELRLIRKLKPKGNIRGKHGRAYRHSRRNRPADPSALSDILATLRNR